MEWPARSPLVGGVGVCHMPLGLHDLGGSQMSSHPHA